MTEFKPLVNYTTLSVTTVIISLMPGDARAEIEANISFATDYVDRGISNSNRGPTVHGGLDYYHDSGFYLGTWASNVDFDDSDEASVEVDFYAAYATRLDALSLQAGVQRLLYPGADRALEYDSTELYTELVYEGGLHQLYASYYYSPDYFGSGASHYLTAGIEIQLPAEFYLDLHVGRQTIRDNSFYGTPDYTEWGFGFRRTIEDFELQLSWQTTDMNSIQCYGGTDWCDTTVTFSVTRYFSLLE